MRKLKPFGYNGITHKWGYDLGFVIDQLEGLAADEECNFDSNFGPKQKRHEKVFQAINILNEVLEMEN